MKNANKEKRRINAFDVLVIFLVICLLATFAYRVYEGLSKESDRGRSSYLVYFECKSEYDSLIKHLHAGDAVYFASTGELLGYLHADDGERVLELITIGYEPDSTESNEISADEAEEESKKSYGKVMLGGKIMMSGDTTKAYNANMLTIGSINVTEGSEINVYTANAEFTVTVISIMSIE